MNWKELITKAIVGKIVGHIFQKTLLNENSRWYYLNIWAHLKVIFLFITGLIFLQTMKWRSSLGLIKPQKNQYYFALAMGIGLMLVFLAYAVTKAKDSKRKG